jgi:DNA-binding winged helix-turn-helix (wHTH) protein/Flp pilus assembly protein TadD
MYSRQTKIPQFELDLGRYELRRAGHRIKLEKKPMELLILLAARRDQLVSREDIAAKLWQSDLFVDTERNINNIVRKLRSVFSDNPEKPKFLETVVGKGYRFVGPLRIIQAQFPATSAQPHLDSRSFSTSPGRSSLVALPFQIHGESEDQTGLSLGFADALIARLGNLSGIDVLPTASVLNISPAVSPAEIAARLGTRFVIRGSIQKDKTQSRVSLELFDATLQRASFAHKTVITEGRILDLKEEIASRIARALNRTLPNHSLKTIPRYSRDPMAYSKFMQGYRLSSSGDSKSLQESAQHLMNAIARDPEFALAHATLSFVCAVLHFEFDPSWTWLEKAEFHCRRSLELDPNLAEAHVANAFLLWGPSKNFQHLEAIAELKRALALQNNLPHAYNRLGTILAHIGLLDHARTMYERGGLFHPRKAVSPSIVQVHVWNGDLELARERIENWLAENPSSKYAIYFAPQHAMFTGNFKKAKTLLDAAVRTMPEDPMIVSLQGVFYALTGSSLQALRCMSKALANPKSFGHAHHTSYQIACINSLLDRPETAFEWLEKAVDTGFACWPFFLKDICLKNLRKLPKFDALVGSLQAKYPAYLGLLESQTS